MRDEAVPETVEQEAQKALDRLNEEEPADLHAPVFLVNMRHPCAGSRITKHTGRAASEAIDLKERYVVMKGTPFAFIYREGRCKKCGQTARSEEVRVVVAAERPPISGRVARSV